MQNNLLELSGLNEGSASIFGRGFSTPRVRMEQKSAETPGPSVETNVIDWDQVTVILRMTEDALRVKSLAHEVRSLPLFQNSFNPCSEP